MRHPHLDLDILMSELGSELSKGNTLISVKKDFPKILKRAVHPSIRKHKEQFNEVLIRARMEMQKKYHEREVNGILVYDLSKIKY